MADVVWSKDRAGTELARDAMRDVYRIDVDGFISLVLACKERVVESQSLFGVQLNGEINCEEIARQARMQFETEAMEAVIDVDSVSAMMGD